MCVQTFEKRSNLGKKQERGEGKENHRADVELPNAKGALAHPARVFAARRFADDGKHADKSRKKEESFRSREEAETLVQRMADRSAEMVQRHL